MNSIVRFYIRVVLSTYVLIACIYKANAQAPTGGLALYLPFQNSVLDSGLSQKSMTAQGISFGAGPNYVFPRAAYFDGRTSKLDFSPALSSSSEITVAMWVKNEAVNGVGTLLVDFDDAAGNDVQIRSENEGLFVQSTKNGGNLSWISRTKVLSVAEGWKYIVWVMGASQSKIYINGALYEAISARASNVGYKRYSNIGYTHTLSPYDFFKGYIAGLRVYERALSDSDVNALVAAEGRLNEPSISSGPEPQNLFVGQSLQLSVSAGGALPLSYQWLKSGAVIAGAIASSYSVASVNTADAGAYSVVVSNAFGAVYSSAATVTVTQPTAPTITTQPRSVSATSGSTVSFTVEASGTPSPSYQWLKDGAPVAGATTRTLIFLSASSANAGTYAVAASNSQGTVVSSGATLTVTAPVSAPAFTSQPASQTASAGSSVVLTAGAVGSPQPAYQWLKNGAVIVGATNAALILPSVSSSDAGNYYVIATNTAGAATSTSATLAVTPASALSNLSVRTTLSSGQTLIVGGVVSGGSKPILVRAAGPALNKFGLVGMFDPRLELYAGQVPVGSNDNWQSTLATTFSRVGAFAFDVGSLDAAFSQSLNGAFTVQAKGTGPGALLVEAYDTGGGVAPRMVNISARNFVGTGADILIAGFALSGTGTKQLLIRAVGPTLAAFGVSNVLTDPKLTVLSGAGAIITENDNWEAALAATFSQVGAFPLSVGSRDAALVVTLSAGASFTVQVSGVNGTTGEALIEIYEVF